ncbi:hypothetical protein ACIQB5_48120 [Streptomyces sp. NPDC088560]
MGISWKRLAALAAAGASAVGDYGADNKVSSFIRAATNNGSC